MDLMAHTGFHKKAESSEAVSAKVARIVRWRGGMERVCLHDGLQRPVPPPEFDRLSNCPESKLSDVTLVPAAVQPPRSDP